MANREQGYAVTIKLFVTVDKDNLESQINAATAIRSAMEDKSLAKLAELEADVLTVTQRFTSREADASAATGTEPAAEPAGEAQDGDAGEAPADPEPQAEPAASSRRSRATAEAAE